jgi:hypothetical protein
MPLGSPLSACREGIVQSNSQIEKSHKGVSVSGIDDNSLNDRSCVKMVWVRGSAGLSTCSIEVGENRCLAVQLRY